MRPDRTEFEGLVAVLDPDVELRIDGGVLREEASIVVRGARDVAEHTATYARLAPYVRPALVNGAARAWSRRTGGRSR